MNRYSRTGVALTLALFSAGCDDFLTGPGLTENPNNPTDVNVRAQLISMQANMFTRLQGQLARSATMYTQQLMGSNNQQLLWGTRYLLVEGDISGQMSAFYTGAGLNGMRRIQTAAAAAGDRFTEGMAKIWEGYAFGTAASIWGDLPYTEALNPDILTPELDSQESLYAAVQQRLDEGIAAIAGSGATGNCDPTQGDLIYCATAVPRATQNARWIAAANTLKARFYLHLVERQGSAAYLLALAAANQGIMEAPANQTQAMHGQAPGDFRTFHGSTLAEGNIWAQFLGARQDMVAGAPMVAILKARSDPRLTAYFAPNTQGHVVGMNIEEQVVLGPGEAGAASVVSATRTAFAFRQPLVTWAENQLILAEAKFQAQGGAAAALPHVNNVRTALGLAPLATVTLQDIMTEKYLVQFQNIDVWSDWKRTCVPSLTPRSGFAEIPGRLPYGSAERNANPNLPLPAAYPAQTTGSAQERNWNDPNRC